MQFVLLGSNTTSFTTSTTANSTTVQEYYEPAAPSQDDVITQLERLGNLKAQGILTDEEFAAEKAKLLG